jgi:hypothetical protein
MKIKGLFSSLLLAVIDQWEHSCLLDNIPAVSTKVGQGIESPARESFLPLFANSSDAESMRPLHSSGTLGTQMTYYNAD